MRYIVYQHHDGGERVILFNGLGITDMIESLPSNIEPISAGIVLIRANQHQTPDGSYIPYEEVKCFSSPIEHEYVSRLTLDEELIRNSIGHV